MKFETRQLPDRPDVTAPDGSDVRILLGLDGGSMAHFELAPGQSSKAVLHRSVEEIWYCVAGSGEMWRKMNEDQSVVELSVGTCLAIPVETHFQFRAGDDGLSAVAVTMPPWPGEDEAVFVEGCW
jgi:mannose-6-phosphate isomerase-like protein (cupin superfamily)